MNKSCQQVKEAIYKTIHFVCLSILYEIYKQAKLTYDVSC